MWYVYTVEHNSEKKKKKKKRKEVLLYVRGINEPNHLCIGP